MASVSGNFQNLRTQPNFNKNISVNNQQAQTNDMFNLPIGRDDLREGLLITRPDGEILSKDGTQMQFETVNSTADNPINQYANNQDLTYQEPMTFGGLTSRDQDYSSGVPYFEPGMMQLPPLEIGGNISNYDAAAPQSASGSQQQEYTHAQANPETKLPDVQNNALNSFLADKANKTFSKADFKNDADFSGVQTATQNLNELGIIRTVKVLSDGTNVEITEKPDIEGDKFMPVLKGQRAGWGTGIVGAAEAVGGAFLSATGLGAVIGVPMMADGARRVNNSINGSTACTAVITKPDGSKQTIKSNHNEDFYNKLYKNLEIIK